MTAVVLLAAARESGLSVRLDATGALKVEGPTEALTRWVPQLRAVKAELVALLTGPEPADTRRPGAEVQEPDTEGRRLWLVTPPTGERFSVSYSPPATWQEVESWHPGALVEPEVEPTDRAPSPWPALYAEWFAGITEARALVTLDPIQKRQAVDVGAVPLDLARENVLLAYRSPLGAQGLLAIARERYDAFKLVEVLDAAQREATT